jgi:hypothetical protein
LIYDTGFSHSGFPGGSDSKASDAWWETWVQCLDQEDSLEKEIATNSSVHAWRSLWTEEPSGLQFMEMQRVGHDSVTRTHTHTLYHSTTLLHSENSHTGKNTQFIILFSTEIFKTWKCMEA